MNNTGTLALLILISVSPYFTAQAGDKHEEPMSEAQYDAKMRAEQKRENNAPHKGKKDSRYINAYDLLIDLSEFDSHRASANKPRLRSRLTVEQRDEIHSRLSDYFPATADFEIEDSELLEGNIGRVTIGLPRKMMSDFSLEELSFDDSNFVISKGGVGFAGGHDGFYLGDPDTEQYYFTGDQGDWTKKSALKAIERAYKKGAVSVEATIIFRDKWIRELNRKNPYREVMIFLQDGKNESDAFILPNGTPTYGSIVRYDQIQYLREHPLVSNIVPNLSR